MFSHQLLVMVLSLPSEMYRETRDTRRGDFIRVILRVGHSLLFLYYELLVIL